VAACALMTQGDRLIPVPKSKAQFRRTRSERQDMPAAALFRNCGPWSLRSSEMKARFRSLAEQQQMMTESGLLKRLLDSAVRGAGESDAAVLKVPGRRLRGPRTCVRLHPDDKLLLSERAAARQTAVATYISVLVRAHLRNLAPLPKGELIALKHSAAEVGAIGRNLNQLTKLAHQGTLGPPEVICSRS
jgi:hypothetical protein